MFTNYLKTALRIIWKNRLYSLLNTFGLAIGIACAGLIFLWSEDELNWDNMHVKKDRLYQLQNNVRFSGDLVTVGSSPRPMAAAMVKELPGIVRAARYSDIEQRLLVGKGERGLYAPGRYADASLFDMFSFSFIEGNAGTAFSQTYSLVITESAAKKFFGATKGVVGKTVRIDNKQDYVIGGLVKDMQRNSTLQFDWLAPYAIIDIRSGDDAFDWHGFGPYTYVELEENALVENINRQLKNYITGKVSDQKAESFLYPVRDIRLYGEFVDGKPNGGGRITQLRMLSVIAWIILIIACINFMNLATAGSQRRAKEVGVRKVLGAGRKKLVLQFMGETLLLAFISAALSAGIMALVLPVFNTIMQKELVLEIFSLPHLAALVSIALLCGLIAGSYPALFLSSFNPVTVLKGAKLKTGASSLTRKGLVTAQFACSVVFIITTVTVYRQIQHVKNRDLGLDKNNLVEIDPKNDIAAHFSLIKNDLLNTGLFENAALADHATLKGGDTDNGFTWAGKAEDNKVSIAFRNVSPEYIPTSGMTILAGRNFSGNMDAEQTNVIINESMQKLMGVKDAVGTIIGSPRGNKDKARTNMTVIAVIKDYLFGNAYRKSAPVILFCGTGQDDNLLYARLKPRAGVAGLVSIREVMKKYNPSYPLEYRFVDDQFQAKFNTEMLTGKVSGIFAVLAIIISCLGLFGLAAFTAQQRIKEIGIRKVLGATVTGVTVLLSKDFVKLVALSCLIAFPVAWWLSHDWLQKFEYRTTVSWWIFCSAGLGAVVIALLTTGFHAIKAAVVNPVKSLRSE